MRTKYVASFAGAILVCSLVGLTTYRDFADGPLLPFAATVIAATGTAFGAYGAARTRWPFGHPVPILICFAIALPIPVLHAVRLLHPAGRGWPLIQLRPDVKSDPAVSNEWTVTLDPGATMSVVPNGILVANQPRARASLELVMPTTSPWWLTFPFRSLLPKAFDDRSYAESASFDLTIEPAGSFFVVSETENLLVQLNVSGMHVTYRPVGMPAESVEILRDREAVTGRHLWMIRCDPEWITLNVDGFEVFARRSPRPLGFIRIGETRSDELHGGTIRIHRVAYSRWWAGSRRGWWPS